MLHVSRRSAPSENADSNLSDRMGSTEEMLARIATFRDTSTSETSGVEAPSDECFGGRLSGKGVTVAGLEPAVT